MRQLFFVVCFLVGWHSVMAQECPYDPNLEWSDFNEVPDNPDNDADAETSSGTNAEWEITYKSDGNGGYTATVSATVTSFFDKGGSWVEAGAKTPELLEHEQYHMDISEYWARQMEEALNGVSQGGSTPDEAMDLAEAEANRVADHMGNKCDELQEQYDEETDHGTNSDAQEDWCNKIKNWLKATDVATPRGTGGQTGVIYNAENGNISVGNSSMVEFSFNGISMNDPLFQGATISLPNLSYGGKRMGLPYLSGKYLENTIQIVSQDGEPLMQGELNILIGNVSGTMFCGQVSQVEFLTENMSPYLQAIGNTAGKGLGVMAMGIELDSPMSDQTGDWNLDADLTGSVTLGVSTPTNPCDVNCDGKVNVQDQRALLAIIAGDAVACSYNGGDLDGDGVIDRKDLSLLEGCLIQDTTSTPDSLQMKQR